MSQPRACQRMLSGRRLDLLNPSPLVIEIEDIAHGLAFVARWNGQTHGDYPYSVAEHSILVLEIYKNFYPNAERKWQLAALLHDAPEYVIGDMISPVKSAVGRGYAEMDKRLTEAIHLRFGLPADVPSHVKKKIKRAYKASSWLEAVEIAGFSKKEADQLFGTQEFGNILTHRLRLHAPVESKNLFLEAFSELSESQNNDFS